MHSTKEFYKADFNFTLFPLKTNLILIDKFDQELSNYIYQKVLNDSFQGDNFLSQQKVYATKPQGHLRRTVKLDPVSEYYLYDLIYRNRSIFRDKVSDRRMSFGYRFSNVVSFRSTMLLMNIRIHFLTVQNHFPIALNLISPPISIAFIIMIYPIGLNQNQMFMRSM